MDNTQSPARGFYIYFLLGGESLAFSCCDATPRSSASKASRGESATVSSSGVPRGRVDCTCTAATASTHCAAPRVAASCEATSAPSAAVARFGARPDAASRPNRPSVSACADSRERVSGAEWVRRVQGGGISGAKRAQMGRRWGAGGADGAERMPAPRAD